MEPIITTKSQSIRTIEPKSLIKFVPCNGYCKWLFSSRFINHINHNNIKRQNPSFEIKCQILILIKITKCNQFCPN